MPCRTSDFFGATVSPLDIAKKIAWLLWNVQMRIYELGVTEFRLRASTGGGCLFSFRFRRRGRAAGGAGRWAAAWGVETPVFMPVGTVASVKAVEQGVLEGLGADGAGAEIILANTYHLYLRPGHELVRGWVGCTGL